MNPVIKLVLWLVVSTLLACGAKAQEASHGTTQDVKASHALICGSAAQAKDFVTQNEDLAGALAKVNGDQPAAGSCLVAPIAFVIGKQVDRVERTDGTYAVTELLIVGVATPVGMLAIEPSVVYTVLKVPEQAA